MFNWFKNNYEKCISDMTLPCGCILTGSEQIIHNDGSITWIEHVFAPQCEKHKQSELEKLIVETARQRIYEESKIKLKQDFESKVQAKMDELRASNGESK